MSNEDKSLSLARERKAWIGYDFANSCYATVAIAISMLANQSANWLNAEICPDRMGNSHPSVVPYTVYEAKDGFVIIAWVMTNNSSV